MKRFKLACDIWVPAPIDHVWAFASEPHNLASISPDFYGIKVSSEGHPQENSRVEISMNPFGVPLNLKWVSLISEIIDIGPQRQFVDLAERGPFPFWKHQHLFEEGHAQIAGERSGGMINVKEKGTWIKDRVEYSLPLGVLGEVSHAIIIRRTLEDMFVFRSAKLRERFAAN